MFFDKTQCSNPSDICELFADFFKGVYVSNGCSQNSIFENTFFDNNINVCNLYLTENCVIDVLNKIDEFKIYIC